MNKSKISIALLTVAVIAALVVMPTFAAATPKSLSTVFAVQNLSTTTAATVHVDYRFAKNNGGGTWTNVSAASQDFTVAAGAATNIAQYLDATMTSGRGSATISADQPIAAVVNQLARGQVATSGSYSGIDSGSASVNAPLVFKALGSGASLVNSTLTIMNTGSAATDFNIVYISGTTFQAVYTATVTALAAGESYYADQSEEAGLSAGFFGSAVVNATTAGGTVAVVGNQFIGANALLTYNGFKSTDGYTSWAVPFYACRLANGFSAPITVQNVGGTSIAVGDIDIAFKPDPSLGAAPFTLSNPAVVASNASFIENLRTDTNCPTGSFGSAIVTAPSNVVVVVNQIQSGTDQALSYNGVRTDSTDKTSLSPVVFSRLSNGFSTAITVQNLNLGATAAVTVTYTPNASCAGCATFQKVLSIPAGGSAIQNHRLAEGASSHPLPAGWFGSARIVSDQPIAGVVNQLASGTGDLSLSFNAIAQP